MNVLIVDDSRNDAELLLLALRRSGHEVTAKRVDDAASMKAALLEERWDVVTCDWEMPTFGGAAALALFNSFGLEIPFIVVSGTVTEELAVRAMRSGARDWVVKDKLARLAPAIERELREGAERLRNAEALRRSVRCPLEIRQVPACGEGDQNGGGNDRRLAANDAHVTRYTYFESLGGPPRRSTGSRHADRDAQPALIVSRRRRDQSRRASYASPTMSARFDLSFGVTNFSTQAVLVPTH